MPVNSFEYYPMTWKPHISKSGIVPLYAEIAQSLEHDIRDGVIRPNDKLPPQRELADYLDVNLSTVARAFKLCTSKGLISGETGRGTFIASDVISNLPMLNESGLEHCINLGASHPPYKQNKYVALMLKQLTKKASIDSILEYSEVSGRLLHKRSGKKWLSEFGLNVSARNILITSGLQNSLAIILASLFQYGDKIATNAVIYPGIKNIAGNLGIQLIPVPYTGRTMDVKSLLQICKNDNIKGIYVIPDHHNPTTISMDVEERSAIADVVKKYNLICMEDGTYSFLSEQRNPPITSIIPEQSIYISTVSNSLSAGLRIAFLSMPPDYSEELINGNSNINVMAPPLEAEIVSQLIDSGIAYKIVEEKKQELNARNKIVEKYLSNYNVLGDSHSQFRWLLLPEKWTGKKFEQTAKVHGVQVFGCERFIVGSAVVKPAARLAISSPKSLELLERGLGTLKEILTE